MRYIKLTIILSTVVLLGACTIENQTKENTIFLEDFFGNEIEILEKTSSNLFKTTYYNEEISDTTIANPNWEDEFALFLKYLPSKTELKKNFSYNPIKHGDRKKDLYESNQKESSVKVIEVSYIKDSLYSVRIQIHMEDKLSSQTMSLSYLAGKSIGYKGEIELFTFGPKEFEIFAEIKN